MSWRDAACAVGLVVALGLPMVGSARASGAATPEEQAAQARRLHEKSIVVDTHVDAPDQLLTKWADLAEPGATTH